MASLAAFIVRRADRSAEFRARLRVKRVRLTFLDDQSPERLTRLMTGCCTVHVRRNVAELVSLCRAAARPRLRVRS
jgi:hypothetical protein